MKKYILTIFLAATLLNLSAQVITRKTDTKNIKNSIRLSNKIISSTEIMPKINIDKLLAEDEIDKEAGLPFRFGYEFKVNFNMQNSGTWTEIQSGRIWTLKIVSHGAYSINLAYDKFYLPENSELYICNEDKTVLQGPITSKNNTPNKQFASDLIEGSAIILEYFEPIEVKGKGIISISKVVHAYRNLFSDATKGFGSSGSCNIDINCPEGQNWQAESNSVALIIFGNYSCSGALINNTCQDFTPYLLTANHCSQGRDVGDWVFRFQYKSPICGGGDDYSYYSYYGASLQASNSISDFSLLELNQCPSGNTGIAMSGWSRNNNAPNSVVGIHHPAGDVMKIATDNEQPTSELNNTHWFVDDWNLGTTEGGSSGSPLYDMNHRIIGQDHAGDGYPACHTEKGTYYGRFDVSWTNGLGNFLDPNNTGAMTTNTIAIPYISGPTTVCTSNSTFTLNNLPPGATVKWTKSGNLSYVSEQGNSYTVKASFTRSGSGWVEAEISIAGCDAVTVRKDFWVGKPKKPAYILPYARNQEYTFSLNETVKHKCMNSYFDDDDYTNYWEWACFVGTIAMQGKQLIDVTYEPFTGDGPLMVRKKNSCGFSPYLTYTVHVIESNPRELYIFPNPANDQFEVEIMDDNFEPGGNNNINIKLFNNRSMPVYTGNSHQKTFRINTGNLPHGLYLLQIIYKGEKYSKQVLIEH